MMMVGIAPILDMAWAVGRKDLASFLGTEPSPNVIKSASPVEYVGGNSPPILLMHGTSDTRVHHSMTVNMYQKLEQAGISADLHLYAGQGHSFDADPAFTQSIVSEIDLFISRFVLIKE